MAVASCSDDEPSTADTTTTSRATTSSTTTTSTVPERPTSTTTTAFDPASVEGQVEAAYLKSWDVYADAVYNLELDEAALAEVYAEEGLANIIEEIEGRIADERAAFVEIEHNYQIVVTSADLVSVVDAMTNHQVLIDPATKKPIESDPNESQLLNFVMKRVDSEWRVALVERVAP